jgi:hypothetical protein
MSTKVPAIDASAEDGQSDAAGVADLAGCCGVVVRGGPCWAELRLQLILWWDPPQALHTCGNLQDAPRVHVLRFQSPQ